MAFLLGQHGTGSEQQQRHVVAAVLAMPGGRLLLACARLAVLGVCAWQVSNFGAYSFLKARHRQISAGV